MFSRLLLSALLCVSPSLLVRADYSTMGQENFAIAGFPTMSLIGSVILLLFTLYSGMKRKNSTGVCGLTSPIGITFSILSYTLYVMGVFFLFGPGQATGSVPADADDSQPPARVNIIGLQLMLGSLVALYANMIQHKPSFVATFVINTFNFLCLCGSFSIFNYQSPIWNLTQGNCLSYYRKSADDSFDRCNDSGFLQLLRTLSVFTTLILAVHTAQAFLVMTDGVDSDSQAEEIHEPSAHDALVGTSTTTPVVMPPPRSAHSRSHSISNTATQGYQPPAAAEASSYQAL